MTNCALFFCALLSVVFVVVVHAGTGTVNLANIKQTIQGFGASSAWQGAVSDAGMNSLFGNANSNQIGLSILRLRIDPNKNWNDEISNAQKASQRGAQVFATPWTPPASMKTNYNVVGGALRQDQYGAYAAYLKSFVDTLSQRGVRLYAISVQNEPDITVTYESCDWTPQQMLAFVKGYGRSVGTKLIAPESFQFRLGMSDPILNDGAAVNNVDIIGGHIYGGGMVKYGLAQSKGKQVWMTEHYNDGSDWNSMMTTAKEIHDCMTIAEYNAYVLWWLTDNQNLGPLDKNSGNPTNRGYIIGQFAKYIRPGYQRVDATYSPSPNVYLSAYKGAGKVVIVAVNNGWSQVNQQISISGGWVSSFTPHITSNSGKRISTETNVAVSNGGFSYTLQAQSVTTFVSN